MRHCTKKNVDIRHNDNNHASGVTCWKVLKAAALVTGAALGTAHAVNTLIALRTPPPDDRLGGVFHRYPGRLGDLAYAVSGNGPAVLLLHGLNTGDSMAEWQNNFAALCEHFTVYALDFLGWGASDKPGARYDGAAYAEEIEFFIEDVIGGPCAIVAAGQSGNYALRMAARRPELVTNLVLVCPPLHEESDGHLYGLPRAFYEALKLPVIGQTIYNVLASRRALGEFARRHLVFDKNLANDGALSGRYIAAHQPGAYHAARALWTGLANINPQDDWAKLSVPALLVWGRNALTPPVDDAPEWLALNPDAHLEVIEQAMLQPHIERPDKFNQLVANWLKGN